VTEYFTNWRREVLV